MARELDPESFRRLLASAPSAPKARPEDELTTADGGAMPNDPQAGFLLSVENERWHQAHPHGVPVSGSDFDHPALRPFLEVSGEQRKADALGLQQGGRYVIDGRTADGHLRAVPRERVMAAASAAAINLARPMRVLTDAEQLDLEYRQAQAGGWFLPEDQRARLNDGRGDPAAEMTAGW